MSDTPLEDRYHSLQKEIDQWMVEVAPGKRLTPYRYLVLSGGGVKGVSIIGAIKALVDHQLLSMDSLEGVATSSIGSLVGLLFLLGYHPHQLGELAQSFDMTRLADFEVQNLLSDFGLDTGERIRQFIHRMMEAKQIPFDITLAQFYRHTGIIWYITVMNLNRMTTEYLSADQTPDYLVIEAVLAAIKVPFAFVPSKSPNGNLLVDGGTVDNYPMWRFEDKLVDTIGIFVGQLPTYQSKITTFEDYLKAMVIMLLTANVQRDLKGYESQTILLDIDVNFLDVPGLNPTQVETLYQLGYQGAMNFFNDG